MKLSQKSQQRLTKGLSILFTALVVVAVIFIGEMVYLSGKGATNADASNAVISRTNVSSTASSTILTVNETSSQIFLKKETPIVVPLKINATNKEVTTTTPISSSTQVSMAPAQTPATSTTFTSANWPYSIGLPYNDGFNSDDGWVPWWGSFSQTNGVLTIGADASGTGGGALFTGSDGWTNYTFSANIDWVKGQTFGLVARYEGDKNYVVCNFSEVSTGTVYVNLRQFINGQELDLARGYINYNGAVDSNTSAAIEVQDDQATCGFDSQTITALITGDAINPSTGDIGFDTWDPGEIIVNSVVVEAGSYNI